MGAEQAGAFASVEAENRLLHRVVETITSNQGIDAVLRSIVELVVEATRGDACFLHLWDPRTGGLVLRAASAGFEDAVGKVRLRQGEGIAGWAAEHRQVVTIGDDKWADPRYKYIPELRGEDYASLISLPMVRRGHRVVGVVNVHTKARRHHTDEEVAVLSDVAGLLAGIVENARLYSRLAEREAELERFAARTIELQELERRRVAADIHDGISQRLVSLWYHLSAADEAVHLDTGVVADELAMAKDLATAAMEEARRAIVGLRPAVLDDLGLGPGLESLAGSVPGAKVTVDVDAVSLPSHVETALFRITQEALQNVAKHADAATVAVSLSAGAGGARLVVTDDGNGFNTDAARDQRRPNSYGLVGMQERAALVGARMSVVSHPGEGTTVTVDVPAPTGA